MYNMAGTEDMGDVYLSVGNLRNETKQQTQTQRAGGTGA